jgi:GNAT superfamily N-acetyltransferase
MRIREACVEDAVLLAALALRSKAHWGYSDAFMDACRGEMAMPASKVQDNNFRHFIAQIEDTLAGFYTLELLPDNVAELDALFVEPSHIGCGVGRRLMDHARMLASELGAHTMIIQSDPHAEAFYRAAGGVLIGQQESLSIPGRFLPLLKIDLSDYNPCDGTGCNTTKA